MFRTFQLRLIIYSITLFMIKLYNVTHSPIQDVTHSPLSVTHHHVLSHSLPGVGRFDPHIIAHIFTVHWGLPSPPFFESSFASGYSRWRCACDLVSVPWWLGALDFVLWVPAPRYTMCQWRSIPWEWWNITWHIHTQNTADLLTAVVAHNTPPRKPDFARLTCPFVTLAPQHSWRKKWRVLPVCKDLLRPLCCGSRRDDPLYIGHQMTPQGVHIRTIAQQFKISVVASI